MPLDYENLMQYKTPFSCPECEQQTFQTDAALRSEFDFIEAECTNCGHPLTKEEIVLQMRLISPAKLQKTLAQYRA